MALLARTERQGLPQPTAVVPAAPFGLPSGNLPAPEGFRRTAELEARQAVEVVVVAGLPCTTALTSLPEVFQHEEVRAQIMAGQGLFTWRVGISAKLLLITAASEAQTPRSGHRSRRCLILR